MNQRASLRIWFSISLAAISAASALGSRTLLRVMRSFQYAEVGGFLSVGRGVAEANQPLIVSSYIGVACTLIAVVGYVRSRNWPPASFVLSASALAFIPFAAFCVGESMLVNALLSARNGVIANATLIQCLLFIGLAGGLCLSVAFAWALRLTPTAAPRRTIAVLVLVITGFILAAIALHLRNAWINDMYTHL
jgi:hypothetical protein